MRIESLKVEAYRLPPAVAWEDATNRVQALELVVVELRTDTGLTGTGMTYTVDVGGTSIKALIEDYLGALVVGMNPLSYEAIWNKLQRQSRRLGVGLNSIAIAAIDIAVWDLIGKHHGQPIYRLIGGARENIPAYISEINLSPADTLHDLIGRVDAYVGQGYRTVKIKIGKDDIEEDIERIRKVQEKIGSRGTVLVDLNQKWSTADALKNAPRLDSLRLGWIEEPIACHDVPGHAALRRAIGTPIALGESLYSKHQFLDYLRADAVDVVQADVAFVGGITEWLKIAHLAHCFGKQVAPHYMMELSLQLLCGVQNAFMLENVVGGSLTELGLLEEPIVVSNALAAPSPRPGHGIVFDPQALSRHRLDPSEVRRAFAGGSK
jgi:L-alanine-DL-glutamate epimerase-like enolase superfamily enzyme